MADAGRVADDRIGDDYERVDHVPPHVNVDPTTVNVNTTNIHARRYNVFNIEGQNVHVYSNDRIYTGPNTPLHFNSLHGKDVVLENENVTARRTKGFKNGICFVNRSFDQDSAVHFKIKETFDDTYGRCRMGFTNRDPASLACSGILKKGMETANSSDGFIVFEPSLDTCAYPGSVVYFSYVDDAVTFRSSKDGAIQTFSCQNVFQENDTLWAFIELKGPLKTVEVENNDFHEVCGSLVQVHENTASQGWLYMMGFPGGLVCFTKTPIARGKYAEFKLSQIYMNSAGHVRVGICKENPDLIRPENLPQSILGHAQYISMEIGAEDALSGNIISLVPVDSQICVVVNHEKQVGIINLNKDVHKIWAVVELFGKTKSVEIITHSDKDGPKIRGATSQKHLEIEKDAVIDQQLSSVADLWLESQVLMNTLKTMADAIAYHVEGSCAGAYWNSAVNTVETAAAYLGLGAYVQNAEVGDAPQILRSEGPSLAVSVTKFVSHIDDIKIAVGGIVSDNVSPGQTKQFKLLRSIAAALPQFDIQLPLRYPVSPPPTPLLLNLSSIPADGHCPQDWYKQVTAKALLETANKIEAAFVPLDYMIRQLYTYGI